MNRKSGISLLDVVILILVIGILAALLIPKAREEKLAEAEANCIERMILINNAMLSFFDTYGDTALLNQPQEPVEQEVVEQTASTSKTQADAADTALVRVKLFTDDVELLRPYLPEGFEFKCPLDNKEYIIITRDSLFYSISCPDGHGHVIKGQFTWEEN